MLVFARNQALLTSQDTRWGERKQGLDEVYHQVDVIRAEAGDDYEVAHQRLLTWYRHPDQSSTGTVERLGRWWRTF
jgi:adenine-specific DNA-methyltransferase